MTGGRVGEVVGVGRSKNRSRSRELKGRSRVGGLMVSEQKPRRQGFKRGVRSRKRKFSIMNGTTSF